MINGWQASLKKRRFTAESKNRFCQEIARFNRPKADRCGSQQSGNEYRGTMTDRHIDRTKRKPERCRDNQMARRLQPAERVRELGAIALGVFNDININYDIIPGGW